MRTLYAGPCKKVAIQNQIYFYIQYIASLEAPQPTNSTSITLKNTHTTQRTTEEPVRNH